MPKQNRGLQVKPRKDRDTWEVGEYVKGRWKRISGGHASAGIAETERFRLERKKRSGHTYEAHERIIGELLADYILEQGPEVQSKSTFEQAMKHLLMFGANDTLADLDKQWSRDYADFRNDLWRRRQVERNKKRKKQRKPALPVKDIGSTVPRELRQLRAAVNHDFKQKRLAQPYYVWVPSEINYKGNVPSRREVLLMARSAPVGSPLRQFLIIGYYTGQRKKFILGLKWPQITEGEIDFSLGHRVTKKTRPHIKMHPRLRLFMRIWRKRGTDLGPVIHINQKPVKDIKTAFGNHRRKLGVQFTPYRLRDSLATHLLSQKDGPKPYLVAQYLGTSVEMLQDRYAVLMGDHFDDVLEAI